MAGIVRGGQGRADIKVEAVIKPSAAAKGAQIIKPEVIIRRNVETAGTVETAIVRDPNNPLPVVDYYSAQLFAHKKFANTLYGGQEHVPSLHEMVSECLLV